MQKDVKQQEERSKTNVDEGPRAKWFGRTKINKGPKPSLLDKVMVSFVHK